MKILIVISDMASGGAQKSLLSFLSTLNLYKIDLSIDLLVCSERGIFLKPAAEFCNLLPAPKIITSMCNPIYSKLFIKGISFKGVFAKLERYMKLSNLKQQYPKLNNHQLLWMQWSKHIENLKKSYDVAISYLDGYTNYLVIDKVMATRKILWVHNEYEKLDYSKEFDNSYFEKADSIVTISNLCSTSLINVFPKLKDKILVLENISSDLLIKKMAEVFYPKEFEVYEDHYKILSIGRLDNQKGFDLAIDAAKLLKSKRIEFKWFIIGDGKLKEVLQKSIKANGLENDIFLIGIKENPYPYIKNCNLFAQTSRYEGKSIVLDEAKILLKPILVTNYTTVYNSITDGINGMIVNMDSASIAEGIMRIIKDNNIAITFHENLMCEKNGNIEEIEKYVNLINERE